MSQPQSFKALKVSSTSSASASSASSTEINGASEPAKMPTTKPEDMSSPHELTAFVESLLGQLENKFDDMSSQILERMSQMSARVDSLESSIQDLINGDIPTSVPQSPAPGSTPSGRKGSNG